MRLDLAPRLVDQVVFLLLRQLEQDGEDALPRAHRKAVDKLYELPASSIERENGFKEVTRSFFSQLGVSSWIGQRLAEFPLLEQSLDRLGFERAKRAKYQDGELFVRRESDGTKVCSARMRLTPEAFLDLESLRLLLRRELLRLQDMLDPAFDYAPVLPGLEEQDPIHQNMTRDRYRLLWESYVEGRLVRRFEGVQYPDPSLAALYVRAYPDRTPEEQQSLLLRMWGEDGLTHRELAEHALRRTGQPVS